jgi:mRNA interferase HicA
MVGLMKTSEFRRFLASRGVQFAEGARHTKLYFNGKQSLLPRHAKELGEGLRKAILKQLNIKG